MPHPPGPVTAADVTAAAAAATTAWTPLAHGDWTAPAGDLSWSCWDTAEHLADDLFSYAVQLSADGLAEYVPFERAARHPGGDEIAVRADPAQGPDALMAVVRAAASLLASTVATAPPTARARHTFGWADPEASAAMGVLETLVHAHDVASGLGGSFAPDPDLCARVLARLLPEVDRTADARLDLLWACGRVALPGRPRREPGWRWTNERT